MAGRPGRWYRLCVLTVNSEDFIPLGSVTGRQVLPVHFYTLQGLGGYSYGVAPLLPVDAVHDAHQAGVPLAVHVVEE